MRDRGFRLDAVAEIEDQPALRIVRQHVVDRGDRARRHLRSAPADRDCPAPRLWFCTRSRISEGSAAQSMLTASTPVASTYPGSSAPAPRGKPMIFASGTFAAHACDDAAGRLDRPARKFARRQHAGPGVEDLQHVGAGVELAEQIVNRVLDQHVDDLGERLRMAIGHQPRRRLVRRALARHHVGRHRPRRAAEADQRDLRIEFAPHPAQRFDTPVRACRSRPAAPAFRPSPACPAARAAGPRRPRSAPSGRARRESPECPKR